MIGDGPRRLALGPAAWECAGDRSGGVLDAAVRVEDALPNAVLCAALAVCGSQQRVAPTGSIDGVLPGGERHVSPSIATFPDGEAEQLQSAERTGIGFEDHFRIGKLPCGRALRVGNDLHGHEVACALGHRYPPRTPRA